MGDISMRGKGKALKMKEGGRASRDLKAIGPNLKGRRKKRTDGAMKRRAEEESMKELRYPTKKPTRRRPERPERDREFKPMPIPMPRPSGPIQMRPMPYKKPGVPKDLEKYMMDMPRRMRPAMKKDGGVMKSLEGMFGKAATGGLGSIPSSTLKKAFEKAKKLKPSGRLNVDDLKKAIDSMRRKTPGKTLRTPGKTLRRQMAKKANKRVI